MYLNYYSFSKGQRIKLGEKRFIHISFEDCFRVKNDKRKSAPIHIRSQGDFHAGRAIQVYTVLFALGYSSKMIDSL